MTFEEAYVRFMEKHLAARKGGRKRRLEEGHGHAEKLFLENVWWPAFGHFYHLHPEYEVGDFRDGVRFLDFAYIRSNFLVCFEIDGYGPHHQNINRRQFADNLLRQNHLMVDGWKVIRFAYDDVQAQPRRCQQIVQQLLGRWLGEEVPGIHLTFIEREIVRFLVRWGKPVTPGMVAGHLRISSKLARGLLRGLAAKEIVFPAGGKQRIRTYQLKYEGTGLLF